MIGSIGSSSALSQWASTLFSKLDTKNQGYIEKSDLESAISGLSSSGAGGSASVDDVFSTLDTDGDGKVTESEMSTSLQNLLSELESQFNSARAGGMGGPGGMGGMPPPPPEEADAGYTQDELTTMAEEIGSSDSKMSSLMSSIAANFDDADTDGNGKVNREEAMAFAQTLESTTSTSSSSATGGSESASASSKTESEDALVLLRIMQLMQAYGAFNAEGNSSDSASTLFAEA